MAKDNFLLPNDEIDSQAEGLLPVNGAKASNGKWDVAPVAALSIEQSGTDLTIYLHALRRHWLMSLGLGLLCAAIIGPAVWFGVGTKYTATSSLQISMQENSLLDRNNVGVVDRDRFEIYKNTQQARLLGRFVLLRALRKPEVAKFPVIQEEVDPAGWLERQISVAFPGKAEVMTVSLSRNDPKEAQVLVRAVVDAYLSEVVDAEGARKRRRLSELETICSDKDQEMRIKRQELKGLAQGAGASDTDSLNTRQRLVLDDLATSRSQAASLLFKRGEVKGELDAQKALLDNVAAADVPAAELDAMVQSDPVARQLSIELGWKKMDQASTQGAVKKGVKSGYAVQYGEQVDRLQKQYDERFKEMVNKAREKKSSVIKSEMARLGALLMNLDVQYKDVTQKMALKVTEAEKIGMTSVDIEMLRSELKRMEIVMAELTNEREKLRVEIRSAPRVISLEEAEIPLVPSNVKTRFTMMLMAMLVGLCFPAVVVALLDTRSGRINTTNDVSQRLRLPVIGSMPLIPAKVIRQLGSPSPRYRAWHLRLTESVDGIAARVLRKADTEQCRVIMVSSATGGEGKTTLATQLALSLARAGRHTVLVDFDLRRPAFDEVFGIPLAPGVSETLRQEDVAVDLVHQSPTDNLSVITAGRWDRQTLASLSNGGAAALFKRLRAEFDFVVVDTSPILPVADARFVSQFVDTVVLSVFRDVSEAPKIQAACDILAAFGVHSVEAVVTGASGGSYDRHSGYESTVSV